MTSLCVSMHCLVPRIFFFGGHQDSGNIGNGGHQDHWFGGHQDSGNHGVTQPVDRLHHLSNGASIMNVESSDDDE
jgi:hypothetical protein